MKIEIKRIGNSKGLILPSELMQRLGLKQGEELMSRNWRTADSRRCRTTRLREDDGDRREIIDEYRDALAALAK